MGQFRARIYKYKTVDKNMKKRTQDIISWILLVLGIIVFGMIVFAFAKSILGI